MSFKITQFKKFIEGVSYLRRPHIGIRNFVDYGIVTFTGHNQYDGKKMDRKNSQDKKEKSDAFSQISLKISLRIFYDYKHSIPWAIWTQNSNQYLSCVLLFNRENE